MRVQGSKFRVDCLKFRIWVEGLGFGIYDLRFRVYRVKGLGFRV